MEVHSEGASGGLQLRCKFEVISRGLQCRSKFEVNSRGAQWRCRIVVHSGVATKVTTILAMLFIHFALLVQYSNLLEGTIVLLRSN